MGAISLPAEHAVLHQGRVQEHHRLSPGLYPTKDHRPPGSIFCEHLPAFDGSLTVLGRSGRRWTIEHRVVDETLTIDDRQSCELVSVTVLDPNATDPEKRLKGQRDPQAPRGELRNLCTVTRTSRSLFLRR